MALDSVLNQNFEDYEIICSDNASTDNTYAVLQSYAESHNKIKIYRNETNLGPVPNWKNCLDHATGEFIHWLWSDDWVEKNFYSDAFELMKKDGTQALTTWNYRSDNPDNLNDKYLSWQFSHALIPAELAAKKILLSTYEFPVSPAAYILPTKLVRQCFYTDIPKINYLLDPVNKGVGVDSLMVAGVCSKLQGQISVLQKPSVVFRMHDNISAQLGKDGSLGKMYALSHLWFLANSNINLSLKEFISFTRYTTMILKTNVLQSLVLKLLVRCSQNISLNIHSPSVKNHESAKAFFKPIKSSKSNKQTHHLSQEINKFCLLGKKIFLAPKNKITESLFEEFHKLKPESLNFIDLYKEGPNIVKPERVKNYDYIFITGPYFKNDIAKSLPKNNIFKLNFKRNKGFEAIPFNFFSILKASILNLPNFSLVIINKIKFHLKKFDMFNIGSPVVFLSHSFQNQLLLHRGNVYLTPRNEITEELSYEIEKLGIKDIRFIDEKSSKFEHLASHDLVIIYNPLENYELLLPKENTYFLYRNRKKGFDVLPLSRVNLLKTQLSYLGTQVYLNIIHKIRLFSANLLNCPLHKNEARLMRLRGKHQGKRAFIIGSGPSLRISDLGRLKNEITFACNKIYLAFNETAWRPTYYTVEDNLVMHEIYHEVAGLKDSTVILPFKDLRDYDAIDNAIYYPLISNKDRTRRCSDNMLTGIYPGHTVTYSMMEMAMYMGITEIYLLGIDFSFYISENEKNKTVIYNSSEVNHFHKDYRKKDDKWIRPTPELQIAAYTSALHFCKSKGIKVFNASRQTKLTVFERVNLDDLLR
jgi:glycosyltransferase involved in cell wall biosynthesis